MKTCKYCGAESQKIDKYCYNCGKSYKYTDYLQTIEKREELDEKALKQFNQGHFNSLKQLLEKQVEYLPTVIEYSINNKIELKIEVLELLEQAYEMMEVYNKLIKIDFPILENQLYDMLQFRFQVDALIKLIIILDKNGHLHRQTVCGLTFIEWIKKDLNWGNLIEFPYIKTFKTEKREIYLSYNNYKLEYGYNPSIINEENIKKMEKLKEDSKLARIRDKYDFNTASQELNSFLDVINKSEKQLKNYKKRDIYYRIVALTLISLYNKAFMLTSSNRTRSIILLGQAALYEKINERKKAYNNYKYAQFFSKRSGAKTKYEKLRNKHGKEDKIRKRQYKYKYKLLKNVKLIPHEAEETKRVKRGEVTYIHDNRIITKKELIQEYYNDKGYNTISTEFLYYYTYLLFLDINDNIEISVNTTYHKDEVITRIKELEKLNLKTEIKKAFKRIHEENPEDIETDKEIEEILIEILDIMGEEKLLKIVSRNRLNQIYDCKYLPCKGIPGLLVYNSEEYFFSDVLTSKEKLKSRRMYWHYYMSEKVDIPIEISIINKDMDSLEKIYCAK